MSQECSRRRFKYVEVRKMGLTEDQVRTLREEGVLVAEGVLTDADLAPVIAEYSDWIDCRARQLAAEGKLKDLAAEAPFARRMALLYAQTPEIVKDMDVMHVRGKATFAFLRNA